MCVQLSLFPNFPSLKPQILPEVEEEDTTEYPSSDGKPMSENTLHSRILKYTQNSLESIFDQDPTVFVAGDLSIYYVEGNPYKKIAPDVMVAFENHKGDRGSYIIHKENYIPPVSTFEIVSPSNLKEKPDLWKRWYKYSLMKVKEYFVIHAVPARGFRIESFKEINGSLVPLLDFGKHTSERLGIEIAFENNHFTIQTLKGEPLNTYVKEVNLRKMEEERRKNAEEAQKTAEKREQKAKEEERKAKEENELLKENLTKQLQELQELRKLLALEAKE